jgi:TolB-like protein/predicted Ser/Thr protein kinase
VSPLGAGGMGEVYRAHDARLDRDVALKVLSVGALGDSTARPRLLREARLAAALNHPNVCTIYEVGEAEGQAYIAMELIEGQPLDLLISGEGLSIDRVLDYGLQIAEAVAHAHERGIVHRDLKPLNALVTLQGRVKVLDFGLARRVLAEHLAEATTASQATLTQAGALVGTLPYMAPEQLRGEPADARSDVWALGVMLYEMAAGARPFKGQTGFEVSSAILKERPAPLPGEPWSVIQRCLEKDPGKRFQHAGEVHAALKVVGSGAATAPRAASRPRLRGSRWVAAGGALLAVLALLIGLDMGGLRRRLVRGLEAPTGAIKLAVLPFVNLSGDPQQEYFSDGLTEEMIAQLGRLHSERLGVIARTSAMRYKKSDKPIDQIGRELGVDYVLEGSAQREAGRVRITAELIQVRNQTQLWAESYERELSGILALQSDVARAVAGALALKLLPAEKDRLAAARPVNPEAYEAYLKGLHHWYNLTPRDLDAAQQYFELALAKDPKYAPAYAGISLVWAGRNQMGVTRPSKAGPKTKAAALKAVELDDTLAEAHYSLAVTRTWHDWDLAAVEPEWRRAIELNPSFPDARAFYSHYLNIMRRPDEAMMQIQRALELDPFNALFQAIYAIDLVFARRYDDAINQAHDTLRAAPGHPIAVAALFMASRLKGMHAEALAAAKTYYAFYGDPDVDEAFKRGDGGAGYAVAMRGAAEALAARARQSYVVPVDVADLYLEAGEREHALEWLEKGFEARDPNMPYIGIPTYDSLRSDPRFRDLLRRMKLPS